MKKLILLILLLPSVVPGQTCKPYAEIAGHHGKSEIFSKDIGILKTLEVGGDCGGAKVISFEFTVKVKGQPVSYAGMGAGISSEMRTALAQMSKKSRIFFDNVKAKFPDGTMKVIPGIIIILKD